MTSEVTTVPPISMPTTASEPAAATLLTIEERTRASAEVAEGLRPLIALAQQAPAFIAVVMDSFDEAMRAASGKGIGVERGLLNGAEAALRFGATMDVEKVRDLDALLKSGVLAPGTLRIMGLAEEAFRTQGVRARSRVAFMNAKPALFTAPYYIPALERVIKSRGMEVQLGQELVAVRADAREAVFPDVKTSTEPTHGAIQHVCPQGVHAAAPLLARHAARPRIAE